VSHYSTALAPDQLMEPFYAGPTRDLTLTADLLHDLGWSLTAAPKVPALPTGPRLLLVVALCAGAALIRPRRAP
jgi:hypothetical protein